MGGHTHTKSNSEKGTENAYQQVQISKLQMQPRAFLLGLHCEQECQTMHIVSGEA